MDAFLAFAAILGGSYAGYQYSALQPPVVADTGPEARVKAAEAGQSLSSWIGNLVEGAIGPLAGGGIDDWLDKPLWSSDGAPLPSRAEIYGEIYDRPGFRGHQRTDLLKGRSRAGEG